MKPMKVAGLRCTQVLYIPSVLYPTVHFLFLELFHCADGLEGCSQVSFEGYGNHPSWILFMLLWPMTLFLVYVLLVLLLFRPWWSRLKHRFVLAFSQVQSEGALIFNIMKPFT